MNIANSRKIRDKILNVCEDSQANAILHYCLWKPLMESETIDDITAMRALELRASTFDNNPFSQYTPAGAIAVGYMVEILKRTRAIFPTPTIEDEIMNSIAYGARHFSEQNLKRNPYIETIKDISGEYGKVKIGMKKLYPYQMFAYAPDFMMPRHSKITIPKIGFCTTRFDYPYLDIDGKIWMSIFPSEIASMEESVHAAHGKVLTLGLGMGYYTYMAALKDSVKKVTVVEKDSDVINAFTDLILPKFGKIAQKIEIIEEDAVEYLNELDDGTYDYCFEDIWRGGSYPSKTMPADNLSEVEIYIKCREASRRFQKMQIDYWINDAFLQLFQSYIYREMMTSVYKGFDIEQPVMKYEEPCDIRCCDYIERLTSDIGITHPAEIDKLLSFDEIDRMIQETNEIF